VAKCGLSCSFVDSSAALEARLGDSWHQLLSKKLSKLDPLERKPRMTGRDGQWGVQSCLGPVLKALKLSGMLDTLEASHG
jgi:hypothetical protein